MADVKIHFSEDELLCMNDTKFLLTKKIITKKIYDLLFLVSEEIKTTSVQNSFALPARVDISSGKISRGENYKGLPYIILDLPKLFEPENIFAYRTMFWWGNYFSCTLHLRGKPLEQHRRQLLKNFSELEEKRFFFSTTDEWEHAVSKPNFFPLKNAEQVKEKIMKADFLKISKKIPLHPHAKLPKLRAEAFEILMRNI